MGGGAILLVVSVLKVDRVAAVEVSARGDTKGITSPEGTGVVSLSDGQTELVVVVAETVDVGILRKRSTETNVLLLKDEGRASGVKQDLLVLLTDDLEGEGLLDVLELELGLAGLDTRGAKLVPCTDIGDYVSLVLGISNADSETVLCWVGSALLSGERMKKWQGQMFALILTIVVVDCKTESLVVRTVGTAGLTGKLEGSSEAVLGGLDVGGTVARA